MVAEISRSGFFILHALLQRAQWRPWDSLTWIERQNLLQIRSPSIAFDRVGRGPVAHTCCNRERCGSFAAICAVITSCVGRLATQLDNTARLWAGGPHWSKRQHISWRESHTARKDSTPLGRTSSPTCTMMRKATNPTRKCRKPHPDFLDNQKGAVHHSGGTSRTAGQSINGSQNLIVFVAMNESNWKGRSHDNKYRAICPFQPRRPTSE